MAKSGFTRRKLLAAAAPIAAAPIVGKLALEGTAEAGPRGEATHIHPGDDAAHLVGGTRRRWGTPR